MAAGMLAIGNTNPDSIIVGRALSVGRRAGSLRRKRRLVEMSGVDGAVIFDRADFPTEGTRFTPQEPEGVALGPIGAIIRGEHQALAHS